MQVHLADANQFQPSHQIRSNTVFAWLRHRLEALRQKQADKRHIAYLRTLDRHFLEDMGVDISTLGEICPLLESFVAPMSTADESKNFFHLPVNLSTR